MASSDDIMKRIYADMQRSYRDYAIPPSPDSTEQQKLKNSNAAANARTTRRLMHQRTKESGYECVTRQHPNPQRAMVAETLDVLAKDPLVSRFMRRKPKTYVTDPDTSSEIYNVMMRFMAGELHGNIVMGDVLLQALSPAEIKATMAHEISHILRLDTHMKRKTLPGFTQPMTTAQRMPHSSAPYEIVADQLAVYLTDDPESCKSALGKTLAIQKKFLASDFTEKEINDLSKRFDAIDETARRMHSPQDKKSLENELVRAYLTEHKQAFPGQFMRKIQNTRIAPNGGKAER